MNSKKTSLRHITVKLLKISGKVEILKAVRWGKKTHTYKGTTIQIMVDFSLETVRDLKITEFHL